MTCVVCMCVYIPLKVRSQLSLLCGLLGWQFASCSNMSVSIHFSRYLSAQINEVVTFVINRAHTHTYKKERTKILNAKNLKNKKVKKLKN